jgi:putative flippase GtrA
MNAATLGRSSLVTWYAVFALLSMVANLGSQKIAWWLYQGPFGVTLSICVGTGVGLVVKYLLDKTWIFHYAHQGITHGIQTFSRYVAMGLATTAIFWAMEFGADLLFHTEAARLTGGAAGLVLGYFVKYQLDKRFVFA